MHACTCMHVYVYVHVHVHAVSRFNICTNMYKYNMLMIHVISMGIQPRKPCSSWEYFPHTCTWLCSAGFIFRT